MIKVFQIDFLREALVNAFNKNNGNEEYFNDSDIQLFSFYEHLSEDKEIERYTELYKDLTEQQNKFDLIGFGIVSVTDTPSISNIKNGFTSPFEWSCIIRCNLGNRDKMLGTLYKAIYEFKGRKVDIAQLDTGKLVCVGTIENEIKDYDFVGAISSLQGTEITNRLNYYSNTYGIGVANELEYVYAEFDNKLKLFEFVNGIWIDISDEEIDFDDDGFVDYEIHNIPENQSFEKFKLDLSFDDIKVDEPYTLDANDYCNISFGGSATLCTKSFKLGNDLVSLKVAKNKIIVGDITANDYYFNDGILTFTELDPLELPSGNTANTIPNQLKSNFFKVNTHTDSIAISLQYTFILDTDIPLLRQWFNYGRYGENGLVNGAFTNDCITPNIIYTIVETWSNWGEIDKHTINAKLVGDISIENTESDNLTIGVSMQIQGGNN